MAQVLASNLAGFCPSSFWGVMSAMRRSTNTQAVSPPAPDRHVTLFSDAHSVLHNIMQDLAHFRQLAEENDQERQDEIEDMRKKLETERYEHREQINKFRYDFDYLVHTKIEGVIDLIEKVHRNEKKDYKTQKEQMALIRDDLKKIKGCAGRIAARWEAFATRTTTERTYYRSMTEASGRVEPSTS